MAEAQDELNAWHLEFTTTLDNGLPYQMDALEAGKVLEDAEAETRMAKQDLKEAQEKLERIESDMCTCRRGLVALCIVHDKSSLLARILKEGE